MNKQCKSCKKVKPLSEFGINRANKDGLNARCKICIAAASRERYNSDWSRNYVYLKRYGISLEDVTAMAESQDYRCSICNKECAFLAGNRANAFVVDHCHKSNKVRGLICATCNRGLGLFYDDPNLLNKAADYLS